MQERGFDRLMVSVDEFLGLLSAQLESHIPAERAELLIPPIRRYIAHIRDQEITRVRKLTQALGDEPEMQRVNIGAEAADDVVRAFIQLLKQGKLSSGDL